jgi:hypothetical protein
VSRVGGTETSCGGGEFLMKSYAPINLEGLGTGEGRRFEVSDN